MMREFPLPNHLSYLPTPSRLVSLSNLGWLIGPETYPSRLYTVSPTELCLFNKVTFLQELIQKM